RYQLFAALVTFLTLVSFYNGSKITISGQVSDQAGSAIINALVEEKGQPAKTSTGPQGTFQISVSAQNAVLVITAKGYEIKELPVTPGKTMNIILKPRLAKAEEKAREVQKVAPAIADLQIMAAGALRSERFLTKQQYHGVTRQRLPGSTIHRNDSLYYHPEFNTEDYDAILENRFLNVQRNAISTFSIDVDGASYSNVRRFLESGQVPPPGSVRIEEMINYFHYDYPQPLGEDPFSINTEMSACSWNPDHRLVLVGLQGRKIATGKLPASNLVFLVDVSGSMQDENKLPLVKASMKMLVDQLREQDKVAIVVYAGNAGLVLPPTSGSQKQAIREAIDKLEAGGSTAGGAGILLAYQVAAKTFITNGNNRVILCTDGDFNVGLSSDAALESLIEHERKSGVFLTALGYGMGNYKDNKMQKLAGKGNGNHAYIDGLGEAKKVLVNEFGGTLFTIAKDVKLQVEFNPGRVQAYRLIGYENRMLNQEDFNNDLKDAGELGSGHTVSALYEIIPAGVKNKFATGIDTMRYQSNDEAATRSSNNLDEIMNIKFRYKKPDGLTSRLMEHPVADRGVKLENTSDNFRFAAAVAEFGMLLRNSEFKQQSSFENVQKTARHALGRDEEGYRKNFLQLVESARKTAVSFQPSAVSR
ncbi:MAG TPA: von Willebrand factor type A domain-containing protein, partial [Chitinophagaceae bacterium]|nr:von Willebrand factor type A domain-containing protein [Chitinophagaceae bacterium]